MIIVEGPDGSGKTTLVNKIVADYQLPISPRAVSKETNALVDLKRYVEDTISQGWQRKLFDRFSLFSDPIYRLNLGKAPHTGMYNYKWQHEMFDRLIKDVRPILVFCLPPMEEVMKNLTGDLDNAAVFKHMPQIYADYTVLASMMQTMLSRDCYVYDYTSEGEGDGIRNWLRGAIG